jgi:hypothetical protein
MSVTLRRAGGFVVGIVLFLFGFSLLQPMEGVVQTGVTIALASVLNALGIGVIAAAALPHTIEVSGQQFKPLGLDVKASGGAAVFLLTLGFIYYMKDVEGAGNVPAPQETAVAQGPPDPAETDPPAGEASPVARSSQPVAAIPDNPGFSGFEQQIEPQSANYFVAWTYCNTCCPQGPDFCEQVGIGEGGNADQAAYMAAEMCIRNGGVPQTCSANVQYLTAQDLRELGY